MFFSWCSPRGVLWEIKEFLGGSTNVSFLFFFSTVEACLGVFSVFQVKFLLHSVHKLPLWEFHSFSIDFSIRYLPYLFVFLSANNFLEFVCQNHKRLNKNPIV